MIRTANLAKEADRFIELLSLVFQYPDHPEWSADEEGIRDIQQRARAYRRLAPLLTLFPSYKRRIQGLISEEDERLVGLSLFYETSPKSWHIEYVGVLPEFRRKGIGRALVLATLEKITHFKGETVTLDVNAGNTPAEELYRRTGFNNVVKRHTFELRGAPDTIYIPSMSHSYQQALDKKKDWQLQYELAKEVAPPHFAHGRPTVLEHYKPSRLVFLSLILRRMAGRKLQFLTLSEGNQPKGWAVLSISRGGRSINGIEAMTVHDGKVAEIILKRSLELISQENSAPIIITLESWQTELISTARQLMSLKFTSNRMERTL